LARQQDESFISQISLKLEVANLTDRPVRIVKATLIRPRIKGSLLQSDVMLPRAGSPYHSDRHPIPSHDTVTASVHLMARGALASQGKSIHATIGITDQFGDEYRLKGISIPSHDKALPKPPMTTRLLSSLRRLPGLRPTIETDAAVLPPLAEWLHGGKFEAADLILNDERRNYAANGRERGGLGSLNVTLQSEPNFGWTEVGKVPSLLWDKAQAKTIESSNIERLLKLVALDAAGKESLEQYLLSHLNKASPFADVGYFIFLALHRMDRTVNALRAARSNLAGDKVFGYSNLLGTLSALISHEHFDINPDLYPQILDALGGDTESNFRLAEKINLARIQQLDLRPEA